jgi:hypothetical protein
LKPVIVSKALFRVNNIPFLGEMVNTTSGKLSIKYSEKFGSTKEEDILLLLFRVFILVIEYNKIFQEI